MRALSDSGPAHEKRRQPMKRIRVCEIQRRAGPDFAEVSARVEGLPAGLGDARIWFRFPNALESWLSEGSEAMIAAFLPIAMALKSRLEVEGHVGPRFYSGVRQIVAIYHSWDRRLADIEVNVGIASGVSRAGEAGGCFFTGGVDSFYTLLENLENEEGDHRISHLIFVRGYADCPLENRTLFENRIAKLTRVASDLRLGLIAAETNLKSFTPAPASEWDWNAGSQLAAVGLCLAPGFRHVFVAAGDTYSTLSPWGSHPLVDPLWSTESTQFHHDGCESFRSQKLQWQIAKSPLALRNLNVCDFDSTGLRNCGTCEKCLRTMIGLVALQIPIPPDLFAAPLDLGRVRHLNGANRVVGYYLRDNLRLLAAGGGLPDLEAAVRAALKPSLARSITKVFQNSVREIDRRYLHGKARSWVIGLAGGDSAENSDLRRAPANWLVRHAWKGLLRAPDNGKARNREEEKLVESGSQPRGFVK
jgi:hypothetical protein